MFVTKDDAIARMNKISGDDNDVEEGRVYKMRDK